MIHVTLAEVNVALQGASQTPLNQTVTMALRLRNKT